MRNALPSSVLYTVRVLPEARTTLLRMLAVHDHTFPSWPMTYALIVYEDAGGKWVRSYTDYGLTHDEAQRRYKANAAKGVVKQTIIRNPTDPGFRAIDTNKVP